MASVKIEKVETVEFNNYKVTYATGTIKFYPMDKAPKTVLNWIDENWQPVYFFGDTKKNLENKLEKALAKREQATATETATEEPETATFETVEQDMEPAATTEPETLETIPEEKQELEPVKVPVLDVVANRRTGGLMWDITQYIVFPVAGLLLAAAAHIVGYLATVAYMLATFAGWMEPRYKRAVAMTRATAGRIKKTANTALETVKHETPVILEMVKAYTVAALEFRRDIISQDKYQEEF